MSSAAADAEIIVTNLLRRIASFGLTIQMRYIYYINP